MEKYLKESVQVKNKVIDTQIGLIEKAVEAVIKCFKSGGKVIVFGNGGSASDAQHMAAEFVGRFKLERQALPAIALSTNTSTLTAVGNDYGYDEIFLRQLQAFASEKDVVIGISTSGKSKNVIKAIEYAKSKNIKTICLTGLPGNPLSDIVDVSIVAPTDYTPFVQESHIAIIHVICKLVEEEIVKTQKIGDRS
ncbi:D-sedoheptulose 7-phosphate isomerase [bacterium]|nr:D-sedoheptulose 7-phosphate isomerase [bacterium]